MLFASTELAARIERVECRLLVDGAAAVAQRHTTAEVSVQPIAGGVAVYTIDGSPLNKLAGLGFEGSVDEDELSRIEASFAARGAALQAEVSTLGDPSVCALLTRRGYTLEGFESVLGRALPAAALPEIAAGIDVRSSEPSDIDAWIDVVVAGFATPDTQGVPSHESFDTATLRQSIADMVAAPSFELYLARRDGEPAGGASMRLFERVAQLTGAATLPSHRRHGVQSALLTTRLQAASKAGCDVAVVTTQPGSKSQQNVQRQGFELLYTRAVLVRHPA